MSTILSSSSPIHSSALVILLLVHSSLFFLLFLLFFYFCYCVIHCCLFFIPSLVFGDGDCSHEVKRHLLLGRKLMTNLDNILKPVYLWPIIGMAKPIQYCKVINLQLNKFILNNKAEILLCQQISV